MSEIRELKDLKNLTNFNSNKESIAVVHHIDNDGLFSGFLVKRKYPNATMYPMNYGKPFPLNWDDMPDVVFVVDYSFDSIETLKQIASKSKLIWIDHHEVIDDAIKEGFNPEGLRSKECSAAKLVWQYLYPNEAIPKSVQYVSDYDIWKWQDNIDALYFQYGSGMVELIPNNYYSIKSFELMITSDQYVNSLIEIGRTIDTYIKSRNSSVNYDGTFETTINNVPAIACNIKNVNSLLFDSYKDKDKYPLQILYSYFANINAYRVTVFSIDPEKYPAHTICKNYGGGGHKGAAGFTCKTLPFKEPKQSDISAILKNDPFESFYKALYNQQTINKVVDSYVQRGYGSLIKSHGYYANFLGYRTLVINNPIVPADIFYNTAAYTEYQLGICVHMTKHGYYRYRIYVLDSYLDIEQLLKKMKEKQFDAKIVDEDTYTKAIWAFTKELPKFYGE